MPALQLILLETAIERFVIFGEKVNFGLNPHLLFQPRMLQATRLFG
jgi:hypothetical protein